MEWIENICERRWAGGTAKRSPRAAGDEGQGVGHMGIVNGRQEIQEVRFIGEVKFKFPRLPVVL